MAITENAFAGGAGTAEVRTFTSAAATTETPVPVPPAKAFSVMPTVYEALGVPVNTVVRDAGTFGARDARMPRRLGKAALSQYIDCGSNVTGAPNADTYAVTMTVLSRITPAEDGKSSHLSTQLLASARPVTVSGNVVQCSSTGRLEEAINRRVVVEAAR